MKHFSLFSALVALLLLAACNGNSDNTAMNSSRDTTPGNITETDSGGISSMLPAANAPQGNQGLEDFTKEAAQGSMMEVQLGNLAMKNGQSQAVKDFGKMMVKDHSEINNELKEIANRKNIELPSAMSDDQQKDYDRLSKKTGKDFDDAYISLMTSDHKDDIKEFQEADTEISDADYKNFIAKTIPILQKHLNAIQDIKK